ncbi:glycosyltransferase family A protein [Mangrovimonas sp. DI 80]|uniref:glycosyltransferase family 2 protein n=1 Tax=Mangrovimonas sp. DI 80 TaxID=1779330 RepID=UPI000977DB4D|nr:glycosyltransferase family A protein [Mangrovimonas sp. DI 80]OMP30238.1 hypothetical protein BKM32_12715 [Mangrovimonas sp. DI 80]
MPFFSVVIPLYNKEKHIKGTIKSVLNQSFGDFEIIIVNDGSTDNSGTIVDSIQDERILKFDIENKGVCHARNYGISKAFSKLIVFLDADDYWYPFHLSDLKQLYEEFPNCGLYAKAYFKQFENVKIASIFNKIPQTENWKGIVDDYFASSHINCIAWTSAVMVPKSIFKDVGNFDEKITMGAGEDIDLWMRIALKFPVVFHNKVSAIHMLHTENRISNTNTNIRQFLDLDKYNPESQSNKSLKTYLDLNRYSIALQYKLAFNNKKANDYIKNLDRSNLNWKQNLLLKVNSRLLKILFQLKFKLRQKGINLSSYR